MEYPQRLSRGLALVKWWLLAIPQYIIIGLFTGTGLWAPWGWRVGHLSPHASLSFSFNSWGLYNVGNVGNAGWGRAHRSLRSLEVPPDLSRTTRCSHHERCNPYDSAICRM